MRNKKLVPFILFVLFVGSFLPLVAKSTDQALFDEANVAMKQKNYDDAIFKYEKIVSTGVKNAAVYFNLGNAYNVKNMVGKAVLNYELALQLTPRDGDILNNLKVAQEKIAVDIPTAEAPFLIRMWFHLRKITSISFAAITQLVLLWACVYFIFRWLYANEKVVKKRALTYAITTFVFTSVLFFWCIYINHYTQTHPAAIVMQESALRHAADSASEKVVVISEGIRVIVLDKIENWYKVTLPNGEQGWVEASHIVKI